MSGLGFVVFALGVSSILAADSADCRLDLGVVVDMTKSIREDNLPTLRKAVRRLVQKFTISEEGTHVSLATFADETTLHNRFGDNFFQSENILGLIDSAISDLYKPTRLDIALSSADKEMFTEGSGQRLGVLSAMVLYTDGRSHPDTDDFLPSVMSLKAKGVRLVVVGIGPEAKRYQKILHAIAGENVFFVEDYDGLYLESDDIAKLVCPPSPCKNSQGLDVAFLLDSTQSVGRQNFKLLKGFLLEICNALEISRPGTHVAFITFADDPDVKNTFSDRRYQSNEAVHRLITEMPVNLGSQTFIDKALEAANEQLFTIKGGDRRKFPNALILLTDGRTNRNSKDFDEILPLLKAKDVHIAAVGIGNWEQFTDTLEEIAGKNTYTAVNYDELSDRFEEILAETCSVDGGLTRWSLWSKCGLPCSGDRLTQTRTRTCTQPPPKGYGKACDGDLKETKICKYQRCSKPSDEEFYRFLE